MFKPVYGFTICDYVMCATEAIIALLIIQGVAHALMVLMEVLDNDK